MIRHELTTSIVRFYREESNDPFQPHDAICTLVWESPTTVMVKGLNGSLSRHLIREFIEFLDSEGVTVIKAFRDPHRTLPFIRVRCGDYVEIHLDDVKNYLARKHPQS
mgnify:CR=1 FL=1